MHEVPILDPLAIPLPTPELPGVEGTLEVWDARQLPKADCEYVIAGVYDTWLSELGDPAQQPDEDPNAIGVGVLLNGEIVAWGALHTVTVTETGENAITVAGTLLAGSGMPGLADVIAAHADGHRFTVGGVDITLSVSA